MAKHDDIPTLPSRPEDADWLRRVPAQFDKVKKVRAWLKKRGQSVESFKASALYKNSVESDAVAS